MRLSRIRALLWVSIALAVSLGAAGKPVDWKTQVNLSYKRAGLGAELMYVDGLLANRHSSYRVFNPQGFRMDLSLERERFAQLFSAGLRVRLDTKIKDLRSTDVSALCLVEQSLKVEQIDLRTGQLYTKVLFTEAIDRWEMAGGRPRLMETRVLLQRIGRGPQLANDKLWPIKVPKQERSKKSKSTHNPASTTTPAPAPSRHPL